MARVEPTVAFVLGHGGLPLEIISILECAGNASQRSFTPELLATNLVDLVG